MCGGGSLTFLSACMTERAETWNEVGSLSTKIALVFQDAFAMLLYFSLLHFSSVSFCVKFHFNNW